MFHHKNIRFAKQDYVGRQAYFATLCTYARRPLFSDDYLATKIIKLLQQESSLRNFAIHAYCLMPDHLHILAEGLSTSSDFLNFVKSFKIKVQPLLPQANI